MSLFILGGYAKFNGLKAHNKNLKTLLAIGGWNEGSGRFSKLVADPETRQNLVRSAIKYLRQHQFDGLDLDWEYPASREGSRPADRENYAQLVKVKNPTQISSYNNRSRAVFCLGSKRRFQ
jgi:chitinase